MRECDPITGTYNGIEKWKAVMAWDVVKPELPPAYYPLCSALRDLWSLGASIWMVWSLISHRALGSKQASSSSPLESVTLYCIYLSQWPPGLTYNPLHSS